MEFRICPICDGRAMLITINNVNTARNLTEVGYAAKCECCGLYIRGATDKVYSILKELPTEEIISASESNIPVLPTGGYITYPAGRFVPPTYNEWASIKVGECLNGGISTYTNSATVSALSLLNDRNSGENLGDGI